MLNHHSELYPGKPVDEEDCADNVINHWISKGFPVRKIVFGILLDETRIITPDNERPPISAYGEILAGKMFKTRFVTFYNDICHSVKFSGWQVFNNPNKRMGPHAVSPVGDRRVWLRIDGPAMAVVKTKYVLSKKLGGVAINDIASDYFQNICAVGINPITTAVWQTLSAPKKIKNVHFKKGFRPEI